jgi:hypothetical protein
VGVAREATPELFIFEVRGELRSHQEGAHRRVTARDALGDGHQVRDDPPVVDREPLPCTPKATEHLIGDQEDPVLITELAQVSPVAIWWDEAPI